MQAIADVLTLARESRTPSSELQARARDLEERLAEGVRKMQSLSEEEARAAALDPRMDTMVEAFPMIFAIVGAVRDARDSLPPEGAMLLVRIVALMEEIEEQLEQVLDARFLEQSGDEDDEELVDHEDVRAAHG